MKDRLKDLGINNEEKPEWEPEASIDDGYNQMESGEASPLINLGNTLGNLIPFNGEEKDDDSFDEGHPALSKHMELFFGDVDAIKVNIEIIINATKRIGEINEEAILATDTETENQLSTSLQPILSNTNKIAKQTKTLISVIKTTTEEDKNKKKVSIGDTRVRENLCNTLTRKFIDEMKEYQSAHEKYKIDIKKKVKRQVMIVKPDVTDEEVDQVIKSEGGRDALYREQILAGGASDTIKTAFQNVVGKYQDVRALEQSVAELHQMFLDFALLTEQQGELLDQIEFNVMSAGDYIEEANEDVFIALVYQKKIRKKQCYIILVVVVVALIIIYPIVKNK